MHIRTCTQVFPLLTADSSVCDLNILLSRRCFPVVLEAWFLFLMTSRWFALRLDSICSVFIMFASFGCIIFRDGLDAVFCFHPSLLRNLVCSGLAKHPGCLCSSGLDAGEVGLVLTYAVTLVGNFQWTMRQSAEVENMVRRPPGDVFITRDV